MPVAVMMSGTLPTASELTASIASATTCALGGPMASQLSPASVLLKMPLPSVPA